MQNKTNDNPIMLGPILLHWDGEEKTYRYFFSHVRAQLGDVKLTIGSDEERAMTNALHDTFSNGHFLLCSQQSSCQNFQCPKPKQSCGKKPGQRKRQRSEKTRTLSK